MCGRYQGIPESDFNTYGLAPPPRYKQSYNVAPGTRQPILYKQSPLHVDLMKWGLVPFWSKEPKVKFSTINARAETIATSPVFREAFKKHRCLVPARGFYEWQKQEDGTKQPYFIHLKSREQFSFAGIWDVWKDAEGKEFKSYAIITTTPNKMMSEIHTRMPVILAKDDEDVWTEADTPIEVLEKLLTSYPNDEMTSYRISTLVNSPANDSPEVLKKV